MNHNSYVGPHCNPKPVKATRLSHRPDEFEMANLLILALRLDQRDLRQKHKVESGSNGLKKISQPTHHNIARLYSIMDTELFVRLLCLKDPELFQSQAFQDFLRQWFRKRSRWLQ